MTVLIPVVSGFVLGVCVTVMVADVPTTQWQAVAILVALWSVGMLNAFVLKRLWRIWRWYCEAELEKEED